jgi:hypothetical protein
MPKQISRLFALFFGCVYIGAKLAVADISPIFQPITARL